MFASGYLKTSFRIYSVAGFLLFCAVAVRGQEVRGAPSSSAPASLSSSEELTEVRALSSLIQDLQAQVQSLNSQLGDLRSAQERATAESGELRRELETMKSQGASSGGPLNPYTAPVGKEISAQPASLAPSAQSEPQSPGDRIAKLEEDQQVMEGKINDQYQTKVESGSKYRLRLSGIVLLNLFENHGTVDNRGLPGKRSTAAIRCDQTLRRDIRWIASPIANQAAGFWSGYRRCAYQRGR